MLTPGTILNWLERVRHAPDPARQLVDLGFPETLVQRDVARLVEATRDTGEAAALYGHPMRAFARRVQELRETQEEQEEEEQKAESEHSVEFRYLLLSSVHLFGTADGALVNPKLPVVGFVRTNRVTPYLWLNVTMEKGGSAAKDAPVMLEVVKHQLDTVTVSRGIPLPIELRRGEEHRQYYGLHFARNLLARTLGPADGGALTLEVDEKENEVQLVAGAPDFLHLLVVVTRNQDKEICGVYFVASGTSGEATPAIYRCPYTLHVLRDLK